jgi:hypothetical protein
MRLPIYMTIDMAWLNSPMLNIIKSQEIFARLKLLALAGVRYGANRAPRLTGWHVMVMPLG